MKYQRVRADNRTRSLIPGPMPDSPSGDVYFTLCRLRKVLMALACCPGHTDIVAEDFTATIASNDGWHRAMNAQTKVMNREYLHPDISFYC